MYLNQIEAFVNIVKYRSFSRAAKKLYLSQPTISAHIKSLESELGVQLLVRNTREILLSDAGSVFYRYALELLNIRDAATMTMKNYTKDISGTLTIASTAVSAQYILPGVISDILKVYPDIFFSVRQRNSMAVIKEVEDFEAELGLTGIPLSPAGTSLSIEPVIDERMVLITPNTAPFRHMKGNFPLRQLVRYPLILREPGSSPRRVMENLLQSLGIAPDQRNILMEMPTTESVKQAVRNHLGISVISEHAVSDDVQSGHLLKFSVDSEHMRRKLYFVRHKNRVLTPAADCFYRHIKQKFRPEPDVP